MLVYFLPIYFQAVQGCSAVESGIRSLPLMIPISICTIAVGGLITRYGHFAPFMVVGSALTVLGCGLIYRFKTDSGPGVWITYQVIAGLALGISFQTPIMAAQALAAQEDVPTTTAILYCKCSHLINILKGIMLTTTSLPTPRRRHLRLHRPIHLQQHPHRKRSHVCAANQPDASYCRRCHWAPHCVRVS